VKGRLRDVVGAVSLARPPGQATAVSVLALVILLLLAQPMVAATAQGSDAILRPDPLSLGLKPNAQGTLTIVVENVRDLYGIEIHLAFDPNIVQVEDANPAWEGVQIEPAAWLRDGFVAVNRVDNAGGRIDFAATLLNPALPLNGSQAVAEITFRARGAGVSAVSIAAAILSTRQAEVIPFIAQDGGIGVNPRGQAPDVIATTGQAEPSQSTDNWGMYLLAGASVLAFLISLGIFIYILRRRR